MGGFYCKKGDEVVAGEPPAVPSSPSGTKKKTIKRGKAVDE
jgi:hypothetical protein